MGYGIAMPKRRNTIKQHERVQRNFDPEDIILRPITMYDVLKHKRMCDASKGSLGDFLGWAETISRWQMKHHLKWIAAHCKTKGYWEAYGAFLNEQMVGFITFSPAKDFLGIQICYYTSALYQSRGICTLLTEVMVQRAFVLNNFHYVELHIDVDNIGSQRVAEKNGFEAIKEYSCSKSGNKGSGKMQVWVKISPKYAHELTLDDFRNGNDEYLAPAYQSLGAAFYALKSLQELSNTLNVMKNNIASAV